MKKGDEVTVIGTWDRKGTVYVSHYVVRSAGKKQIHLIKLDGSNAEYRTYRASVGAVFQMSDPFTIVPTEEYTGALAMDWAVVCLAEFTRRIEARKAMHEARGTYDAFEQRVYADNIAELHEPRVQTR